MIGWGKKTSVLLVLWAGFFLLCPVRVTAANLTNYLPIFQFEVFYYDDNLDISPGPDMSFDGTVHGNRNIYASSSYALTFSNTVTSAGSIVLGENPASPFTAGTGPVDFLGTHLSGAPTLLLKGDMASNVFNGHAILDVPPIGESATNGFGTNRLYYQTDMIVVLSNSSITVKSGIWLNNGAFTLTNWQAFLKTNNSFWNVRESATVKAMTLDVGKLRGYSASNMSGIKTLLGNRDVSSIYIADMRTMASTNESGIVLTNGKYLPSMGLTVATPNPAYVIGDYNTSNDGITFYPNTNETSHTLPAAIMCDAIHILSGAWNPAYGTSNLSARIAVNTTVNAAIVAGNVPTANGNYSGGVENFFRWMEDWSTKTFTFNGSIVQLFASRIAANPWLGPGSANNVYNPPTRYWSYDRNFDVGWKQPPLTPLVYGGIVPPPTILANPQSTNITVSSTLTLSVAATNENYFIGGYYSFFLPTYQWYFNTNTLLINATNSTLTLTNVQWSQAGKYHVVVSNAAGATISAFATLTVSKADTVTTLGPLPWSPQMQPFNFTATVSATNGTPTGQVEFKEGGNSLGIAPLISGSATLSNVSLTMGEHTLIAYYSGDAIYNPSASIPAFQYVGFFFQSLSAPTNGAIALIGSGAPGQTCVLDQADGLQPPIIWTPIATNTADASGQFTFSQPISSTDAPRFFRLRLP